LKRMLELLVTSSCIRIYKLFHSFLTSIKYYTSIILLGYNTNMIKGGVSF
jgi:hypothetical protein